MEESDNTAYRGDDEVAIGSTRYPTSGRLLAAIHRGDEAAITEFFLLYKPLLRDQARRMSVGPGERDELVTTLLDDVVLHLMEHQIAPRHLTQYVVAAFRNRARNWHRDSHRRTAAHERAYATPSASKEKIVAECHSEYAIRSSGRALVDSSSAARTPITSLAERLGQALTRDEAVLIIWAGRHAPLREVAAQLGISYAAARVRLYRLRERLRKLAIEHLRTLKTDEREELERFFRRAEVSLARKTAKQQEKTNGQF